MIYCTAQPKPKLGPGLLSTPSTTHPIKTTTTKVSTKLKISQFNSLEKMNIFIIFLRDNWKSWSELIGDNLNIRYGTILGQDRQRHLISAAPAYTVSFSLFSKSSQSSFFLWKPLLYYKIKFLKNCKRFSMLKSCEKMWMGAREPNNSMSEFMSSIDVCQSESDKYCARYRDITHNPAAQSQWNTLSRPAALRSGSLSCRTFSLVIVSRVRVRWKCQTFQIKNWILSLSIPEEGQNKVK